MTIHHATQRPADLANATTMQPQQEVPRIKSGDLMQQKRELEIDHAGRIYRLRITQLNKLILTA